MWGKITLGSMVAILALLVFATPAEAQTSYYWHGTQDYGNMEGVKTMDLVPPTDSSYKRHLIDSNIQFACYCGGVVFDTGAAAFIGPPVDVTDADIEMYWWMEYGPETTSLAAAGNDPTLHVELKIGGVTKWSGDIQPPGGTGPGPHAYSMIFPGMTGIGDIEVLIDAVVQNENDLFVVYDSVSTPSHIVIPNVLPTASLAASVIEGIAPLDVDFDMAGTVDDTDFSWTLDTGDGIVFSGNSLDVGSIQNHIYAVEGVYTATLTVTDEAGAVAVETVEILVHPPFVIDAGGPYTIVVEDELEINPTIAGGWPGVSHNCEWTGGVEFPTACETVFTSDTPATYVLEITAFQADLEVTDYVTITVTPFLDSDGDGLVDHLDNCPLFANADQLDTDGDSMGDVCDDDDDNDGFIDTRDTCPLIVDPDQSDNDRDRIGDLCDDDDDNDAIPDTADTCPFHYNPYVPGTQIQRDSDRDGVGDACDDDRDGDGVPDAFDDFPDDKREFRDTDGDGIGDNADTDDDNDGIPDSTEKELGTDAYNLNSQPMGTVQDQGRINPVDKESPGAGWLLPLLGILGLVAARRRS